MFYFLSNLFVAITLNASYRKLIRNFNSMAKSKQEIQNDSVSERAHTKLDKYREDKC